MKILFVEDNPYDADLLQRELARQAPWSTLQVVSSLSQARQQLAQETKYDLALIDLRLPDGSGMELLAEIRREALPLAVIILTGAGDEEDAVAALKAGADDYLVKREDYLARLPQALETALKRFHAEALRKTSPLKLLYVENDAADVDLTCRHLARYAPHIHLEVAHDASEALRRLTSASARYDVLLLDYCLPGLNALEMLKKMQQEHALSLPVVLVTGRGNEESAVQALRLGAEDYLTKHPGYLFQLPSALENAYHRARLAREKILLCESELKFRNIFDYAGDAIFIHDMNGNFLEVNQVACERLAYSREELLAMTLMDIESLEYFHLLPERIKLLQKQGQVIYETAHVRRDGNIIPIEISMHTIKYSGQLAVMSVARDITERKRAEETERQAMRHWQKTFDASADAICLLDMKMNILRANLAMAELTGIEVEALLGRKCCEIFHGHDAKKISAECPVMKREKLLCRIEADLKIGSNWFNITIDPVPDENGLPQHMVHVIRDITARKNMENNLRQRLAELEALNRISSALRSAETPKEMLPVLLEETLAVLQTDVGAIWLYHPASEELRFSAARGWFAELTKTALKAGEGISGKVFMSGQPHVSREFAVDPQLKPQPNKKVPEGWGGVCIPIKTGIETVGVLSVSVPLPREITPEELRLLSSLAEMTGTAVHRLSLHEDTVRQLQQLQSMRAVDQAITASLDLTLTLDILLEHVVIRLEANAACVFLYNPHLKLLEYAAGRGFKTKVFEQEQLGLHETAIGRAALERRTIIVADPAQVLEEKCFNLMSTEGFKAFVSVPLIAKEEVKGVLAVFQERPYSPDSEWLSFLEALASQAAIALENASLFDNLQRTNLELLQAYDTTIEGWVHALDLKDEMTEGHSRRVTEMTESIARTMNMKQDELVHVRRGALLHDIGKMGIPDTILLKPGKLTVEEWEIMRRHPRYAYEMLSSINYLRPALDIPYCHHEKWDGTGYPRGLKGEEIPLAARIFAVVDVYDALTSERPYRPAWSREEAIRHIHTESGKHFDPEVVEIFGSKLQWGLQSPSEAKTQLNLD
jgi:PAS domain S-box-containing protein